MLRGLVTKELRQHGMALLFLLLLLVGGVALVSGNRFLRVASGSGFEGVRMLHFTLVPLACLVLAQVLVAAEFRQKTQLFLEALPLPRWRMIAVKYGLGLAAILLGAAVALLAAWQHSRADEALTPRFAAILFSKSAAWAAFVYSLLFAHAFLGRYRLLFGVLVVTAFFHLDQAGVATEEFWPLQLVDHRFAHERHVLPAGALAWTALLAAACAGVAFALGLVRDATVAALLAERMSGREKLLATLGVFAAIMTAGYVAERRQNAAPVAMPGAVEAARGLARVAGSAAVDAPRPVEDAALAELAPRVAEELASVGEYLGCASLPPVFLVHRRDLSPGVFQNGGLKPEQGLLVRADLTADAARGDALRRWIIREILLVHSRGRAGFERNAWVLDGFPHWWTARGMGQEERERAAAVKALPAVFTARTLRRWFSLRKDAGDDGARALAASGLHFMAAEYGDEACRRFLSATLRHAATHDARPWLRDVFSPPPRRFRAAIGASLDAFAARWSAHLRAVPDPLPAP
jgi:hypothetical protein